MTEAEQAFDREAARIRAIAGEPRPAWYNAEREKFNRCGNRSPWTGECMLGCTREAPTFCRAAG